MPGRKKKYATINNPNSEAVVSKNFRFADYEQAMERLRHIKETFVNSRKYVDQQGEANIVIWIKGFEVDKDEEKRGYSGNFAKISCERLEDGKFTLIAEKLLTPLENHPQKRRPKKQHPNWGHPVLRSVKKKRIYKTIEDARSEIEVLHTEFPETTIPLTNKLYLMIYDRSTKPPVQKYTLEIHIADEGGYYLTCVPNSFERKELPGVAGKKKEAPVVEGEPTPEEPKAPVGKFTSMVEMRKKKK